MLAWMRALHWRSNDARYEAVVSSLHDGSASWHLETTDFGSGVTATIAIGSSSGGEEDVGSNTGNEDAPMMLLLLPWSAEPDVPPRRDGSFKSLERLSLIIVVGRGAADEVDVLVDKLRTSRDRNGG
jgi:hypothetical protein